MSIMFFFKDLISIRATFVMANVNATVGPLKGQLIKPLERAIIGMCMVLELKNLSLCANW